MKQEQSSYEEAQLSVSDETNLPKAFQVIANSDIKEANDEHKITLDEDFDIDVLRAKRCVFSIKFHPSSSLLQII